MGSDSVFLSFFFFFSLLWKENTHKTPLVFNFQCQKIDIEEMETIFNKLTTVVIVSSTEDHLWQWNSKLDSLESVFRFISNPINRSV